MSEQIWWTTVEENWKELLGCIRRYHPTAKLTVERVTAPKETITAPNVEVIAEHFRRQVKRRDPIADAEKAKEEKNVNALMDIFNETWIGAPESRSIYTFPGFSVMCDLLEGVE